MNGISPRGHENYSTLSTEAMALIYARGRSMTSIHRQLMFPIIEHVCCTLRGQPSRMRFLVQMASMGMLVSHR